MTMAASCHRPFCLKVLILLIPLSSLTLLSKRIVRGRLCMASVLFVANTSTNYRAFRGIVCSQLIPQHELYFHFQFLASELSDSAKLSCIVMAI